MIGVRPARLLRTGDARWGRHRGTSLAELLAALGVGATVAAMALAPLLAGREAQRAAAAGRYLSSVFQAARMSAVQRGVDVGIRFDRDAAGYGWTIYADGNGNGIRTSDIASAVDTPLGARRRLSDTVPGVEFGAEAGTPQVDSSAAVGGDPIRVGASDILSFSPGGTSTSGTVYLLGRGSHAWAVRVLGATARVRVNRFDRPSRQWVTP